jgi:hydrogenase maturation protease
MNSFAKVLIQGIGNPLRGDDALGPLFIESILDEVSDLREATQKSSRLTCEWVYQLQIEQAEQWSHFSHVLIVDADVSIEVPFQLTQLSERTAGASLADSSVASHEVSPSAILALSKDIFDFQGCVYLLSLRAKSFHLGEPLSSEATESLRLGLIRVQEFARETFGGLVQSGLHFL